MNLSAKSSQVGSNVSDFHPGDIVSGEGHVTCGRCRNCLAGRRHLCAHTSGVGVNRPGAFAELIALPMTNIWRHHTGVDSEVAAIFDPFGNAVHTALSFPVLGEDVLITGAGPIGLMAIPVVRHAGARYVVITDLNPFRLDLARKMGATLAVNPEETPLPGRPEAARHAGRLRRRPGNVRHAPGVARHDRQHVPRRKDRHARHPSQGIGMDWRQIIFNMLTIKGIYGREMYETWYKMSVMLESGVDISPVITHRFDHTEFEKGFEAMMYGHGGQGHPGLDDVRLKSRDRGTKGTRDRGFCGGIGHRLRGTTVAMREGWVRTLGVPGKQIGLVVLGLAMLAGTAARAQTAEQAWLKYMGGHANAGIPQNVRALGGGVLEESAVEELKRGLAGMEGTQTGGGETVLGTLDEVRKAYPLLKAPTHLEAHGFWLRRTLWRGHPLVVSPDRTSTARCLAPSIC